MHEYELVVTYNETGIDQSDDMNKKLEGKVQIYDAKVTTDIEGTVSDANQGDYVVVTSTPKESAIVNGKFKVVGLEPGIHTVTIYNSSNEPRYNKQIT